MQILIHNENILVGWWCLECQVAECQWDWVPRHNIFFPSLKKGCTKISYFHGIKGEHTDIALHNFIGLLGFYHKPEKFQDKIWANNGSDVKVLVPDVKVLFLLSIDQVCLVMISHIIACMFKLKTRINHLVTR